MPVKGLKVCTPTSVVVTGSGSESATINSDGSVSFTACTSLSLNDIFTSEYDNYKMTIRCAGANTNRTLMFRLRDGGIDESSPSNYYDYQQLYAQSTTIAGSRNTASNLGRLFTIGHGGGNEKSGGVCYFFEPYTVLTTAVRAVAASNYSVLPSVLVSDYATTHYRYLYYSSVTLFPSADTFEGLVTVAGWVK